LEQPDDSISIFISYSHRDEALRAELDRHLSSLQRQAGVAIWHDRWILAGEEWAREIDTNLETADIILLLVSHNFIASDYCYDIEMKRAVERYDAGEAVVIPIILSACVWKRAPFGKIQGLPRDAKPIESAANRNEAFAEVVEGIERAIEKLRSRRAGSGASSGPGLRPDRWMLPYLCDRNDQEEALANALRDHQQKRDARPLVCLVHGDEWECHAEFLERMKNPFLRRYFNLEARKMEVKEYRLLPSRGALAAGQFWGWLGNALIGNAAAGQSEIWPLIARHEEPMLLMLELGTEDFAGLGDSLLRSVIDFCERWPDLPPGRIVLLCISLKYQRLDRVGQPDSRKKKLRQLNQTLRSRIAGEELISRAKVSVVVLPELEAIPRGDVERWRSAEQVRNLPDREIRAWFADKTLCNNQGRIPMELLAEKLTPFVE
jgi:TIR domain/inactive STAND